MIESVVGCSVKGCLEVAVFSVEKYASCKQQDDKDCTISVTVNIPVCYIHGMALSFNHFDNLTPIKRLSTIL
jgi:hypothetical protein